ncbi:unknown [Clostridium sp. CAG:451]|nr:unknown [Clostridium sp. CAG:451]
MEFIDNFLYRIWHYNFRRSPYDYVEENYGKESINKNTSVLISLKDTYDYVEENYGVESINKNTSVLSCNKDLVIAVEKLGLDKTWNLVVASCIEFGFTTLEEVENIVNSIEFKKYPELFTSQTLAYAKIEDIQEMIDSQEFKKYPELFTSTTLAHAKIEDIQVMINSQEFKKYPELFTSTTLAHAKIEEIQEMTNSKEFKEHPELFTSTTLAHAKIEEIKEMINSKEYKEHPELFTSTTLAHAKIEDIKKIIHSEEFKEHTELFTSQTLANAKIKEIQKMINSKEFKKYPELFTSSTLAHAKIEDIQKLLEMSYWNDIRYKDLLTSSVAAKSKQMITKLPVLFKMAEYYKIDGYLNTSFLLFSPSQNFALINYLNDNNMPLIETYWNDIRYKDLLTSSVVAKSKQMITRLPALFKMAEYYKIDGYLNTSFLLFSPSQNFALINYLNDNNIPLIENDKLNKVFGKQPGVLKKKYGIDIKEQMLKYDFSKFSFDEDTKKGGSKNAVR